MRKILLQLLLVLMVPGFILAQENSFKPVLVKKATYFDVTPPLRDMPVVLPGERDRSWKDNIIQNLSVEPEIPDEVQTKFAGVVDPVAQEKMGDQRPRGPVKSFDGVKNVNGVYPPDTDGDVGPNHYFQMINLSFAIWDKEGNKLYGPVDNSTLWQGFIGVWTGTNDGDPIILYDHLADRWIATQFAIYTSDGTYWELIAVSQTGDPLGAWYRYAFEYPAFNDYPKFGVWHDAYYASYNMFGEYTRAGVSAYERDKMLVGDPAAQMIYIDLPGTFSMMPSDLDGPVAADETPNYFAHLRTWDNQNLEIYAFDVNWEEPQNSTFTLVADLATEPFDPDMGGITQPNTNQKLSSISDRLMFRLQYRNFDDYETMVTNHTVKVGNRAGVRWYELRRDDGDWYIYQQGTYAPDNDNRWMGSVAMNANGNLAVGYTVSSSDTYPSVRYAGRTPDAPLGELNLAEMELVAGTSSQSGINRWGDYSMMSVDPVDDTTFWYTQEYMGGGWKTRIGSFDFGPVLPPDIEVDNDTMMCEQSLFVAHVTGNYIKNVYWTTDGDGQFIPNPPVNMIQGYIRGYQDIENGGFQLNVTAYGFLPGQEAHDSISVEIVRVPTVYAGEDTTICNNTSLILNGEVTEAVSFSWNTNGDGYFSDTTILNPAYTPGPADIENGSAELLLAALPYFPCEDIVADAILVTLDPCTGFEDATPGSLQVIVQPNPSSDKFMVRINGNIGDNTAMKLYDVFGKQLMTFELQGGKNSAVIDLTGFYPGIYLLKVQAGDSSKVIKMQLTGH